MPEGRLGILAKAVPSTLQGYAASVRSADRLTEFDILIIAPTMGELGLPEGTVPYELVEQTRAELADRRSELRDFLGRGGVAVAFLRYPTLLVAQYDVVDVVSSYDLIVSGARKAAAMSPKAETGNSVTLLDSESPFAEYVNELSRWECTIERGVIVDDPHGYRLAENRNGRCIAYVEHVGRGSIYWVSPPENEGRWMLLVELARRAWRATEDPLEGLGGERLQTIASELIARKRDLVAAMRRLEDERQAVLAIRQRLVDEDRAVARSLEHRRAARSAAPAKALDLLHRMVETIEHEYGGESSALAALGYSKATLGDITRPANEKAYRARHEGGEGATVPKEVLERAYFAADDILGRFLERRLNDRNA